MADKWTKYEVSPSKGDKWSKHELPNEVISPPSENEGPGWFMPGSRSESALRGATQAATFGFGDEAQAFLRSLASDQTYKQLRDEQRAADDAAFAANPLSYVGGSLVGGAPQALGIARSAVAAGPTMAKRALGAAMGGAAQGAVQGAGAAREMSDIPRDATTGAAIGGALSAATQGLGDKAVSMYKNRVAKKEGQEVWEILSRKNPEILPTAVPNPDAITPPLPTPQIPSSPPPASLPMNVGGMSAVMQGPAAPLAGAALNIGRSRMMDENVPDYTTDPYSAVIHDAQQGAMGAGAVMAGRAGINLGGAAIRNVGNAAKIAGDIGLGMGEELGVQGKRIAGEVGRRAIEQGNRGMSWVGHETTKPIGTIRNDPFGKLTSWLNESNRPIVAAGPDMRNALGDVAERKAAMEASKSAEGRSTTNTESPIAKSDVNELMTDTNLDEGALKTFDLLKRRGNEGDLLKFLESNGVDITSANQLKTPEAGTLVEKFGWNSKDFADKVIAPHEKLMTGPDIDKWDGALPPNKNVVNSTRTLEEFLSNTTPEYRQSLAQPGMSTKSAIERAKNIAETGRPTLPQPEPTLKQQSASAFMDELRARSAPEYMNLVSNTPASDYKHIAKFGRPAPADAGNSKMIQKLVDNGIDVTNPDALLFPKAQQIMRADGLTENEISGVIKSINRNVGDGSITSGSDPEIFNPLLNYFKNQ